MKQPLPHLSTHSAHTGLEMLPVWEWKLEAAKQALAEAEHLLWVAQLEWWPDSVQLTHAKVIASWLPVGAPDLSFVAEQLIKCLQFPAHVFYECGLRKDGGYRWRGCRYGVMGYQYLSGFNSPGDRP